LRVRRAVDLCGKFLRADGTNFRRRAFMKNFSFARKASLNACLNADMLGSGATQNLERDDP
jgi:hypothetical protein